MVSLVYKINYFQTSHAESVTFYYGVLGEKKKLQKKNCPWYKIIDNTSLAVDAFNYDTLSGVKYYLLSHFHSDHYRGLTKKWDKKVVASSVTKRLVVSKLGVREDLITVLDPGAGPIILDGVQVSVATKLLLIYIHPLNRI